MRNLVVLTCVAMLAACGASREDLAVEACEKAISERITDKTFQVDRSAMAANATPEGDDIVRIRSTIVFDPGLPREETQNFDCRARFTADRSEPDIISLSFIW